MKLPQSPSKLATPNGTTPPNVSKKSPQPFALCVNAAARNKHLKMCWCPNPLRHCKRKFSWILSTKFSTTSPGRKRRVPVPWKVPRLCSGCLRPQRGIQRNHLWTCKFDSDEWTNGSMLMDKCKTHETWTAKLSSFFSEMDGKTFCFFCCPPFPGRRFFSQLVN